MPTSLDFIVRDTLNSRFSLFSKTDFHASALSIQSIQISAEVYKFVNCSLKQFLTVFFPSNLHNIFWECK